MKPKTNPKANAFSDRLVTLVQVFFAVVIGGGLIEFHEILFPPKNTIAFWALFGVYVTSIMSWTGYHSRIDECPYVHSRIGILRLFTDILIVILYAFLLFAGASGGASIESYLWGFSIIFLLYVVAGCLRRKEYRTKEASKMPLLVVFLICSLVVSSLFSILIRYTDLDIIILNWCFVFLPLLMMVAFRWCHEWSELNWRRD